MSPICASPQRDAQAGTAAAVRLLTELGNPTSPTTGDELVRALLALLASYGREIPPSHQLRGFCAVLQRRIEGRP